MWVVFVALVGVAVVAGVSAWLATAIETDEPNACPAPIGISREPVVLSHITADGEVIEYPIIRGETLVTLAETLGEIAALPEVAV